MTLYSQTPKKTSKWRYNPQASLTGHFGYSWQGINTFDAGIRLITFGVHENISLMTNLIVFNHNVTYASPEVKLRYFKPLRFNKTRASIIGIQGSLSYWTTKVLGTREQRITPEIGLGLGQMFHLCYGYNIPVSRSEISFISKHRISLRFMLN